MSKRSMIREKLEEGYTQMEVAKMLGVPQSSVSYHSSDMNAKVTCNKEYCRYRFRRCKVENERIVIYKEFGVMYMTNETNYFSYVRNANKVCNLKNFKTFDEAVQYLKKYGKADGITFIDRTGGKFS